MVTVMSEQGTRSIMEAAKMTLPLSDDHQESSSSDENEKRQDVETNEKMNDYEMNEKKQDGADFGIKPLADDNKTKKRGRPRKSDNAQPKIDVLMAQHDDELKRMREKFREKEAECELLNLDIMALRRECSDKSHENNYLQEVNSGLLEQIATTHDELKTVKEMLREREGDFSELLEQLVLQEKSPEKLKAVNKPKGLLITDQVLIDLHDKLSDKIDWEFKTLNISDLLELQPCDVANYDIILLITGICDMNAGLTGMKCFDIVREFIFKFNTVCPIVITTLPPSEAKTQISIFNLKMQQFFRMAEIAESCQIIDCNFRDFPRSEMVDKTGLPTKKCLDLISSGINSCLNIPEIRPKKVISEKVPEPKRQVVLENVRHFVEIPKENVGKVIGRNGRNIKKLSETHGVKITIGNWFECSKEVREEINKFMSDRCENFMDALILTGLSQDVIEAAKSLQSFSIEPPTKKAKF